MGFAWVLHRKTRDQSGLTHGNPLKPILNPCEAHVGFTWVIHGSIESYYRQWACPSGTQVGFEWVNRNPCKSHRPTVTHAKPVRDYDGLAIWDLSIDIAILI